MSNRRANAYVQSYIVVQHAQRMHYDVILLLLVHTGRNAHPTPLYLRKQLTIGQLIGHRRPLLAIGRDDEALSHSMRVLRYACMEIMLCRAGR